MPRRVPLLCDPWPIAPKGRAGLFPVSDYSEPAGLSASLRFRFNREAR